MDAFSIDLFI